MKYWNGYGVDSDGNIYNKDGSLKSLKENYKGYLFSNFYWNGSAKTMLAHRIVAETYIGKCPDGYEVDHIDNCRSNNSPSNLRYVSKSENNQKSYDSGNRNVSGERNANNKYSEDQIREFLVRHKSGMSIIDSANAVEIPVFIGRAVLKEVLWKSVSKDYL